MSGARRGTLQNAPILRRAAGRVGRHIRWARSQGVARLVEEDELNPWARATNAARRWQWRRRHAVAPGTAVPIFLVGLQRSGTNMVVRGLERSPEFEVRNENDRAAFARFQLRPDGVVRDLIDRSRHRYVLLKPLCDSHRVDHLLDGLGTAQPGRALWVYRGVDGRARSAVAKFGDANRRVLTEIASGEAGEQWQAQRLSAESLDLIRSLDCASLSPESAAALFWFVRNSLYFELGLHERDDIALVSYERFVAEPETSMRELAAFAGFAFDPSLVAHVDPRWAGVAPLELDPRVRDRCDELEARLAAASAQRTQN